MLYRFILINKLTTDNLQQESIMIIKVCGMRDEVNIQEVERLNIDWMGFIFHPGSTRYVGSKLNYIPSKEEKSACL